MPRTAVHLGFPTLRVVEQYSSSSTITLQELRELTRLDEAGCLVRPSELELGRTPASLGELKEKRPKSRIDALLTKVQHGVLRKRPVERAQYATRFFHRCDEWISLAILSTVDHARAGIASCCDVLCYTVLASQKKQSFFISCAPHFVEHGESRNASPTRNAQTSVSKSQPTAARDTCSLQLRSNSHSFVQCCTHILILGQAIEAPSESR